MSYVAPKPEQSTSVEAAALTNLTNLAMTPGGFYIVKTGTITFANIPNTALTNPMTQYGDMIYGGISGVPASLPIGTIGQFLSVAGGKPLWTTIATGGTVTKVSTGSGLTGGDITTTGTVSLSVPLQPIATLTGNSLKVLRVNLGETAVEYATVGAGTVTTVSVTSANGISGSVATPTTTPAITLSLGALTDVTSFNGLVVTANTGVITTGSWAATAIPLTKGGTGTDLSAIAKGGLISGTGAATVGITTVGTDGQVLSADSGSTGGIKWIAAGGTGTVTTVSVASANGFAGTVANATTTPAITLTTSITGILKGNATAISAATAGSDYAVGSTGLAGGQTIAGSTLTLENLTLRANAADLTTGAVIITSSKEASSSTVGSVQLAGGLAVAKRVYALDMTVTNTITGSVSGSAGSATTATTATNANNVNLANDVASATDYLVFTNTATGNQPLKTATAISVNPSTAAITATTFIGALTGTASGNLVSGGALGTPSSGTLTSCSGLPIAGLTASTSTALGVGSIELGNASDTTLSRTAAGVLAVEGMLVSGYTSTATAAGTTTMDITYAPTQVWTGTTTQTIKLPTTGVVAGQTYNISNNGTSTAAILTVQSSGANTILIMSYGCSADFVAVQATPTTAAHWTFKKYGTNISTATSYTTDTGTSLNCDYYDQFLVTAQAGALKLNNPTGTAKVGQNLYVAITGTAARALTYDTQFLASTVALPTTTVTTAQLNMGFKWNGASWVILAAA